MKKYVLFAFIALFFVSSHSAWAQYVKVTDENGTVSWIPIAGTINGTIIEIYKDQFVSAIDRNTKGSIDLNEVWSESGGRGTHYQVTSIGSYAFSYCNGLTSINIPNSVTSIKTVAFEKCTGLTSVNIPSNVTSIEECVFIDCKGLTSITIPNNVKIIGANAFNGCTGLTSVTIPNSVITIGDGAFYGCEGLISIDIPNSVTSIGSCAFCWCTGFTSITIPSSVTSIGSEAFSMCSSLASVIIPSSVTSIEEGAFHYCSSLTSIISYITDVFETGWGAFNLCGDPTLYVPKGTKSQYQSTADWNRISNIVEMSNNQFDVNNDGSTDISDVVSLVNFILDSSTTNSSYDVNGDGNIDISDVVSLVNMILGQ